MMYGPTDRVLFVLFYVVRLQPKPVKPKYSKPKHLVVIIALFLTIIIEVLPSHIFLDESPPFFLRQEVIRGQCDKLRITQN